MGSRPVSIPCLDESGRTVMSVALDLDNLPQPDKLINLLVSEVYPFEKWFEFARAYLANGAEEAFTRFSTESIANDIICEFPL